GYERGEIDKVDKSSLVCLNFQCSSHDTEGCPDWWEECYVPSPKSEANGTSSDQERHLPLALQLLLVEVEGGLCKCYYCNGG
ncbi:hypothetical protein J1N35_028861, partial [Gossypium stocksii]